LCRVRTTAEPGRRALEHRLPAHLARRRTSHLVSAVFSCFVHACEMRPVILLACVLSVGACTRRRPHQPQALQEGGYVSVSPAVRNAIIAAAVGMVLASAAQNVSTSDACIHDSPALAIEHPQYTDDTHRSTHATVWSWIVPGRPAHVDA
jgi:hypothetical protein